MMTIFYESESKKILNITAKLEDLVILKQNRESLKNFQKRRGHIPKNYYPN